MSSIGHLLEHSRTLKHSYYIVCIDTHVLDIRHMQLHGSFHYPRLDLKILFTTGEQSFKRKTGLNVRVIIHI